MGVDQALSRRRFLATGGAVLLFSFGRRAEAVVLLDKAIELDPNLTAAWIYRGMCKGGLGREQEAMADFAHVLRLSPRDPRRWVAEHGVAWAHLMAGRYHDAVAVAIRVLQSQPGYGPTLRVAIAAHALAGHLDLAREILARHLAIEPQTRLLTLRDTYLRRMPPKSFDILADGLRKAGFPE